MDSWWTQMLSMALALFLLMDPIGNVPIFVSILKDIDPKTAAHDHHARTDYRVVDHHPI